MSYIDLRVHISFDYIEIINCMCRKIITWLKKKKFAGRRTLNPFLSSEISFDDREKKGREFRVKLISLATDLLRSPALHTEPRAKRYWVYNILILGLLVNSGLGHSSIGAALNPGPVSQTLLFKFFFFFNFMPVITQ